MVIRPSPEPDKTLEPVGQGKRRGKSSLGHFSFFFFFPDCGPFTMSRSRNPKFKDSREKKKKKSATWRNKGAVIHGSTSVTLKQTLSGEKKKKNAAKLQVSYYETKQEARKCSNQQYFTFPSGGTEAPAYEPHANRKKAFLR